MRRRRVDFTFTKEHTDFAQEVEDFIKAELPPRILAGESAYAEENFDDSMAFRRKLGKKKWIGIGWPVEYGGLGAGHTMQMLFHDKMVYYNAPLDHQAYQVGPAIISFGNESLKKRFLKATAEQEIVWAQGFSEPNAGSDLASLATTAVADGDEYVINGQKIWTTYGHKADWIHILTRTDPAAPKHKGISYFIMDMRQPGITIQPLINMADEHDFNQVFFDNVRVPKENLIGDLNQGWYVAMTTLNNERSGIRDVAMAQRAFDNIVDAIREAPAVLGSVRDNEILMHRLADMTANLHTARLLSYRVAWMQEHGEEPIREASIAKLFASEVGMEVGRVGMQVLGLHGLLRDGSPRAINRGLIGHEYISNIPSTIAAGSSEVNRNIIATKGLGLPR